MKLYHISNQEIKKLKEGKNLYLTEKNKFWYKIIQKWKNKKIVYKIVISKNEMTTNINPCRYVNKFLLINDNNVDEYKKIMKKFINKNGILRRDKLLDVLKIYYDGVIIKSNKINKMYQETIIWNFKNLKIINSS